MNYSEITDTEINARVAKKLDGVTRVNLPIDGTTLFHAPKIQIKRNGKWEWFDPCNSWADAGPIIQDRGISLYHDDGNWQAEMTFLAPTGKYGLEETASKVVWNKNPLRAAMIVFLMMKEADNG